MSNEAGTSRAASVESRRRWHLLGTVAVSFAIGLSVWHGFATSVERSMKLHAYRPGASASTILSEMGPATTDVLPTRDQQRLLSSPAARVIFYDTAPWWGGTLGVALDFDRDDRLLRTWNVVE